MRVMIAILYGLIGMAGLAVGVALFAYIVAGVLGMSDFEGGRAMFSVFVMGPLGGLVGLATGCAIGWKLAAPPITVRTLVPAVIAIGILGLAGAVLALA